MGLVPRVMKNLFVEQLVGGQLAQSKSKNVESSRSH